MSFPFPERHFATANYCIAKVLLDRLVGEPAVAMPCRSDMGANQTVGRASTRSTALSASENAPHYKRRPSSSENSLARYDVVMGLGRLPRRPSIDLPPTLVTRVDEVLE
jgi:hypothetical protein